MGYLQSTNQSSIHEAVHLGAGLKSERAASLTALGQIAHSAANRGSNQVDRVTLSPAADALAHMGDDQGPASAERLNVLREAIKAHAMPIYPKAIAAAILREESHGDAVAAVQEDGGMAQAE